jgi:hypothetical protein
MRAAPALLALLLLVVPAAALPLPAAVPGPAPPLALPPQGPDLPTGMPMASVVAFEDERFSFEERWHTTTIAVPGAWTRVVLEFTGTPEGDPWDRLFGVSLGGVEVLRGTTPRATFTVKKEVTEYAPLLPAGGVAEVGVILSTYVAVQKATVVFHFYDDISHVMVPSAEAVVGAWRWGHLHGNGAVRSAVVDFGPTAPSKAAVEIALTGHGGEEFWFQSGPALGRARVFHLRVDGTEVATVVALPYTYAFLGFAGANGQMTSTHEAIHAAMWWTAQQGLDVAGVHAGVGEIPPYRAELRAEHLALLQGARTVELVQENGGSVWNNSVAFLLT